PNPDRAACVGRDVVPDHRVVAPRPHRCHPVRDRRRFAALTAPAQGPRTSSLAPVPRGHLRRRSRDHRSRRGAVHRHLQCRAQPHRRLPAAPPRGRRDGRRGAEAVAQAARGDARQPPRNGQALPQGRAIAATDAEDPLVKPKPTHAYLAGSRYLALQRLARAQKRTTAELLQLYVLESFLRRLVRSRHDHTLVLKGGMLLAAFDLRRATRDVDVLALNTDNDPAAVQRLIVNVTSVEADDGVEFLQDTITAAVIRDDDVYPGVRASLEARLTTARLKFSVDINVGDPVIPAP